MISTTKTLRFLKIRHETVIFSLIGIMAFIYSYNCRLFVQVPRSGDSEVTF